MAGIFTDDWDENDEDIDELMTAMGHLQELHDSLAGERDWWIDDSKLVDSWAPGDEPYPRGTYDSDSDDELLGFFD